jgi:pyrophosphatase PpaX
MTNHFKTFMFDLDATLVDSHQVHQKAVYYALRDVLTDQKPNIRHEFEGMDLTRFFGLTMRDIMLHFGGPDNVERLLSVLEQYESEMLKEVKLFPGVMEVLIALKETKKKVVVVTSQNTAQLKASRRFVDIEEWVDLWVSADDVENPKPHADPILKGLSAFPCDLQSAIMIGDSVFDIKAGQAARIKTGAALWGAAVNSHPDLLALKPDFAFLSPSELHPLIN